MKNSKLASQLILNLDDNTPRPGQGILPPLGNSTERSNARYKPNTLRSGLTKREKANEPTSHNQQSSEFTLNESRIRHQHTLSKDSLQLFSNDSMTFRDNSMSNLWGLSTRRLYHDHSSIDSRMNGTILPSLRHIYTETDNNNDDDDIDHIEKTLRSPTFTHFSRSMKLLDSVERKKLPLSKELFYSKEHIEINKQYLQSLINEQKANENPIRGNNFVVNPKSIVLKENKKELIDSYDKKKIFFKVNTREKLFPMFVNITHEAGAYEIYVSSINPRPDNNNYEFFFKTDRFQVDYYDPVDVVYIGIVPMDRLKMEIEVYFPLKKPEKKKPLNLLPTEFVPVKDRFKSKKMKIYEMFHEKMNEDEYREMRNEIGKINGC